MSNNATGIVIIGQLVGKNQSTYEDKTYTKADMLIKGRKSTIVEVSVNDDINFPWDKEGEIIKIQSSLTNYNNRIKFHAEKVIQ